MSNIKVGDHVAWHWVNGLAEGVVREVRTERTQITSKGKQVVRNGTTENPALIIDHKSGNDVLKLANEVQKTD